jgi:site-specific recombinase XerD
LEISSILNELHGRNRLIIERLYGRGLRVSECLRLRVQDIDRASLTVRDGKEHKDRQTLLSHKCAEKLTTYIEKAIKIQKDDNQQGIDPSLPNALERK